jgi:hypothetical protein
MDNPFVDVREKPMRLLILLLLIAAATVLTKPLATPAQGAYSYPWCSIENTGGGPGGHKTCAYDSWEQCMAARPGSTLCVQNSLYGPRAPGLYYRRPRARRHKS